MNETPKPLGRANEEGDNICEVCIKTDESPDVNFQLDRNDPEPEFCTINNDEYEEEEDEDLKDLYWCHICRESFMNGIELANHFRSRVCWNVIFSGKGASLKCELCHLPIRNRKQHWLERHKRPELACRYCGTLYMKSKFYEHLTTSKCYLKFFLEVDLNTLKCIQCGRNVLTKALWTHKCRGSNLSGTFQCGNCQKKFFREGAYKKHCEEATCNRKNMSASIKQCKFCKGDYKVGSLADHLNEFGCFLEFFEDVGEDQLKCKLCENAVSIKSFNIHKCEKRASVIKCAYCGKKFATLRARAAHYRRSICAKKKYEQVSKSKFKCKGCGVQIDVSLKTKHKCRKEAVFCEYCKQDMRPYSKRVHMQKCIDTLFDEVDDVTRCKNCGHRVNPQRHLKIMHLRQCIVGVVCKRDRGRPSKIGVSIERTRAVESKCTYCREVFGSEIELRNHRRKERGKCYLPLFEGIGPKLWRCKDCGCITSRKLMTKHCLRGCYSVALKIANSSDDSQGCHFVRAFSDKEVICLKCNNVRLWEEVNAHYKLCWRLG